MQIRTAAELDRAEIVELYQKSQAATQIPNPDVYPPDTLGAELYSRDALQRYVAIIDKKIVGHGLIENPNPISIDLWRDGISVEEPKLIEFGGAFVAPDFSRRGVYSELLSYRLHVIRSLGALPVSATWVQNMHVQRQFIARGGEEVARQRIGAGELCLFVFQ